MFVFLLVRFCILDRSNCNTHELYIVAFADPKTFARGGPTFFVVVFFCFF